MFFVGTYEHKLNSKKQLTLPAKFREQVDRSSATRSLYILMFEADCAYVYTHEQMQQALRTIQQKMVDMGMRSKRRDMLSKMITVDPDANGRFVLPEPVRKHLGDATEIVWLGNIERMELWAKNVWDQTQTEAEDIEDSELREMLLQELDKPADTAKGVEPK
jgi:MraZ protein